MKILIATGIYPPEIGGPATFVPEVAEFLSSHGDAVSVLTYGDERTRRGDRWRVEVVPRVGGPLVRYVRYAWRAFCLARQTDVVFAQGGVSEGFPAAFGAFIAGKPLVLRIPGDYAWEMSMQRPGDHALLDEFLKRKHGGIIGVYERIERWVARRAQATIVPSRYLASVVTRWGVESKKIHVICNAVARTAQPSPSATIAHPGTRLLFTAIRAVPWKGGDFLIALLPDLPADHELVIAGDGPELAAWKRKADELGVAGRVRFLGRIPSQDMVRWFRSADLFLLATGYEGYPHTVAEAVATGLPCVVSDRGGNPETAEQFPNLVRVAPYLDRSAWLAAIAQPSPRGAPQTFITSDEVGSDVRSILSTVCAS